MNTRISRLEVGDATALEAVLQPVDIRRDGDVPQVALDEGLWQRDTVDFVKLLQPEGEEPREDAHHHDEHHLKVK